MTNISDKNQKLVLEYKRHPILTQESRDNILILLNEQKNILKQKLSPNQNPQDIQLKTLEADTKEYEKVANIILNDSSANIIYNQDKMHILEQKERANYTILKDYTKQLRDNLIRINEIKEGPISGWKEELERKINPIKSELLKIQKNIQIHTERDKSINQEKEAAKATISRAEDFHTKLSSTLESHNNALTLLQKQAIIAKLKQINPNYLKPIQDFCRQPRKQEKYSETIIACKTLADHSRSTTNENVIIAASNIIKFLDKKRGDDQTILARQYNHIKDIIHPLTLEDLHQHAKRESDNIAYDIKQKKTIFANHVKISSQLIRDIRSQANHKLGTDEIYKEIFDLCGKVSVGFKFVNNQTRIQWNNKYGYGDISEEQAIDYAIQLKERLEDLNPKENTILGRANDQMDQWHEEAGLE